MGLHLLWLRLEGLEVTDKNRKKPYYCVRYIQLLSEIAGADHKESSYLASLCNEGIGWETKFTK